MEAKEGFCLSLLPSSPSTWLYVQRAYGEEACGWWWPVIYLFYIYIYICIYIHIHTYIYIYTHISQYIHFTILIILRALFNGIKYIHNFVRPSPPSISRTVSLTPIETPCLLNSSSHPPHTPTPAPGNHFVFLWIWLLWVLPINGIIQYLFLCVAYFTQQNVFEVHPSLTTYQNFIPF